MSVTVTELRKHFLELLDDTESHKDIYSRLIDWLIEETMLQPDISPIERASIRRYLKNIFFFDIYGFRRDDLNE